MTVKQLKLQLEKYPDNMEIFMAERTTDFQFGYLHRVYSKKINFMEEPDGEVLSEDTVVILTED